MSKTYMVTGGAGFIGSNFVLYLLDRYEDVLVINVDKLTYAGNLENLKSIESDPRHIFSQTDICDKESIRKLFDAYNFDYVVNFAAESHVDRSIKTPEVFAKTNVMGTICLLEAARSAWEGADGGYKHRRFLQVSTDEVYGSLPLDDPTALFRETTPLNPHSPYSASKAASDMLVMAYGDTYGLPVNVTRCSNNYGPLQFPEKLIPLMIHNAVGHKKLPIYGDGENVRDWLYVEDHCKAIDMVLSGGRVGEVYNIGGHNERSNNFIVRTIIEETRKALDDPGICEDLVTYVQDRKGHDRRYGIAPDKIMADLGWHPETAFEDGIVRTIRWYLDHREWIDNLAKRENSEDAHDEVAANASTDL